MTIKDSEPRSFQPTWRVEGDTVVIVVPKGHDVYPEGREVRFKAFTPTDMVVTQGKVNFPNQDGITADSLRNREFSETELEALIKQFEEANRVIDNLQQLKEKIIGLINQMMPRDFKGTIQLKSAALGKNIQKGDIIIPGTNEIRTHGFFFQGLEYHDRAGNEKKYVMALDSNGKYNYDQQSGFLYIATD